jgi:pimeloyl-ACP methyl ester carboxylesterase
VTTPAGAPLDLVLLHGALGARAQLVPLLAPLVQRSGGYLHVHALELSGHGETPAAAGRPFRIEQLADDLAALLDGRGIGRALFFGYSMGGYVALRLAAERPERVAAVATLGTKFVWDPATARRGVSTRRRSAPRSPASPTRWPRGTPERPTAGRASSRAPPTCCARSATGRCSPPTCSRASSSPCESWSATATRR